MLLVLLLDARVRIRCAVRGGWRGCGRGRGGESSDKVYRERAIQ